MLLEKAFLPDKKPVYKKITLYECTHGVYEEDGNTPNGCSVTAVIVVK